ncbi:hypothetical protein [Methylibium sp.]|uniref:hypothetical protein n=1 Tax=Methylibium sp. TaxID=2067992 RepID=UPI003D119DEE
MKPVVFDPYGRRRSSWRLPRWLVLLLTGIVLGAGGVVLVQERYLPPRLSASASTALRASFEQAEAERQRLQGELGDTSKRLEAALADRKGLADELATSRGTTEQLRKDVAAVVASLPPDPRGGAVEVRAGRFTADGAALAYDVILTRERAAAGKPLTGVLQFVVAGASARGTETTVSLKPVAISLGSHESLRGSVPLPEGFKPRQATVNVLDRVDGKLLGMRVMYVK